ncbi:MAG: hypothetical protein WBP03_04170 [Candidatus Saccharimonadales bacterium]
MTVSGEDATSGLPGEGGWDSADPNTLTLGAVYLPTDAQPIPIDPQYRRGDPQHQRVTPPPPPRRYHPDGTAADRPSDVRPSGTESRDDPGSVANRVNPNSGTDSSSGHGLSRWLSAVLFGRGQTGADLNTALQDDGHQSENEDTIGQLSRQNNGGAGAATPVSPVTEYGRHKNGGQFFGRGGKPVRADGETGATPKILNERAQQGARVIGGAAIAASGHAGGWLSRPAYWARDTWIGVSKEYADSFAETPAIVPKIASADATLSQRARIGAGNIARSTGNSLGYAVMRALAPVQAYGSPAIGGAAAGALLIPGETINERNSVAVLALSVVSSIAVYYRSRHER